MLPIFVSFFSSLVIITSLLSILVKRGARDLKAHTSEMCELQRTLDNELKLQEFLGIKGQHREMADLQAKKEAERKAKREEMQNKIASYTEIFNLVKEFTGEIYLILNLSINLLFGYSSN